MKFLNEHESPQFGIASHMIEPTRAGVWVRVAPQLYRGFYDGTTTWLSSEAPSPVDPFERVRLADNFTPELRAAWKRAEAYRSVM